MSKSTKAKALPLSARVAKRDENMLTIHETASFRTKTQLRQMLQERAQYYDTDLAGLYKAAQSDPEMLSDLPSETELYREHVETLAREHPEIVQRIQSVTAEVQAREARIAVVQQAEAVKLAAHIDVTRMTQAQRARLASPAADLATGDVEGDALDQLVRERVYGALADVDPAGTLAAVEAKAIEPAMAAKLWEGRLAPRPAPEPAGSIREDLSADEADQAMRRTQWRGDHGDLVGDTDTDVSELVAEPTEALRADDLAAMSDADVDAALSRVATGKPPRPDDEGAPDALVILGSEGAGSSGDDGGADAAEGE